MKWFLYAISVIWIAIGCCTILYNNETRNGLSKNKSSETVETLLKIIKR